MKNYDKQENEKYLIQIQQLLKTAKIMESDIEKLNKTNVILNLLLTLNIVSIAIISYLNQIVQSNIFTHSIMTFLLVLFAIFLPLIIYNICITISKISREKRAFKKLVEIIQDIIPFYYEHMSMLEKANIEAQLARLDISGFSERKDKSTKSIIDNLY